MIGTKEMRELSSLKRELKCWENMFQRAHGRKPNKEDIEGGPKEIKDAYRKYKVLKGSLFKEGRDGDKEAESDDVFGKDLNKKKKEEKEASIPFRVKQWADITPVKLCHGQRPKKNKIQAKDDVTCDDQKADCTLDGSISERSEFDGEAINIKFLDTSEKCITSSVKKTFSSNFLYIKRQSKLSQSKRRSTISSAWLEKCKPDLTGDTDSNKPLNSVLHQVDSESDNLLTENHNCADQVTKRNDVSLRLSANGSKPLIALNTTGVDLEGQRGNLALNSNEQKSPGTDNDRENSILSMKEEYYRKDNQCVGPSECQFYEESNEDGKAIGSSDYGKNASNTSMEKSLMASPTLSIQLEESSISKFDTAEKGHTPKAKGLKRKAVLESSYLQKQSKKSRLECDLIRNGSDVKQEEYEQNIVYDSMERQGSSGDSTEGDPTTSNKNAKSSSTRPSSGLVSENFKRLDMKHRSYRRRGGGISGGAYKRRAWKQIMKSRGEFVPQKSWSSRGKVGTSGKSGVCFKCGQEGHWAKNCRGPKKHKALPLQNGGDEPEDTEMEDFEQFPTIEEAAMMAAGVPIASYNKGLERDEEQGVARGAEYRDHVLLPHQLPRPVYTPPTPPPTMEPLFLPVDGKPVDPPKEVFSSLKKLGFTSFRSGQQDAVMRILCGLSTLVVLSTGAGKSLCYQLPAFMYSKKSPCLTLVISPLVSLMEDQITGLPHGLKGACLHTNLTKAQRQKVTEDLCGGKVLVLLLSPEALVGGGSGNGCLPPVSQLPPVAFACIDEAHCVSEWSHNFRPSYLRVCKVLREKFGVRCFLGLTATATRATAASVAEHLGIAHDTGAVIRGGAVPPNLSLSVSCDTDRTQALLQLLQGRRFSQCDSVIIYCTRREQTEKLASTLRTCLQSAKLPSGRDPWEESVVEEEQQSGKKQKRKGKNKKPANSAKCKWDAECYHAGMSAAQRRKVQKRFMTGQLRVVVATVAFGMGLDKSDVRAIVHYNLPRSFESYVQEIGRAGRDGLPAHCHVFLDPEGKDMCELRRHVYANTVDRSTIKKLVNNAFPRCHCKELYEKQKAPQEIRESNQKKCFDEGDAFIDDFDSNIEAELQAMDMNYHKEQSPEESVDTKQEERSPEGIDPRQGTSDMASGYHDKAETESVACREEAPLHDNTNNNPSIHCSNSEQSVTEIIENADVQYSHITHDRTHRLCGGHEVAMPTEFLIQELDMREESIATLLCYLELHPNRWLEVLQPIKSTCTVKFYGGKAQLRSVAQKIPPIAAAVSHNISKSGSLKSSSTLSFPVVEVADKMGWDLVPVTRELRALQWNTSLARDPSLANMGQSGILVEFSDLSFHHRAPGDLSDVERDSVCDFLEDRILAEERSSLQQLQFVYDSLKSVSSSEFWQCADTVDEESDKQLKNIVQSYFEDPTDKTRKELTALMKARRGCKTVTPCTSTDDHVNWDVMARDIRALVGVHHDHSFTGRAVARIFHGIDSPCYPAEVWGRDRRFWRKHLDVEFNSLRNFATRELIRLR